ncbi:haloalkane dehalogenase [Microscilla marina]|uniref:Haloalkane dehalogenase n=1 Tax=Microscilla marina ATCC 23134 TaxID=313606 RepID=A1ZJP3_MICM2|nr:haloalkane dehalogenase [Microscilla marina]EAY29346.1 haloalkane dehalogenase [Microscilla marina ATCC 23134]
MQVLQTPDHQFEHLPEYPFAPHYAPVASNLQMHYVDEGSPNAEVVLLLHGEPSWSFLYRKMIPVITKAGYRAIAPDLIGFGKSDKPANIQDYSYKRHLDWMQAFIDHLGLNNITLFCQDWGGLLGLRMVAENSDKFKRVVASNTFLPTGDIKMPESFVQWKQFSQTVPEFPVGNIIQKATTTELSSDIVAAYNAPFPDESYKAGARVFPALVPDSPTSPESEANRNAWKVLSQWTKPFLTCFGDADPITKGADKFFQQMIPGTKGQAHTTVAGGGHFIQEDRGEELGKIVVEFIKANK